MYRPQHRPAQFETILTVNHPAITVYWLAFLLRPCERASEVAPHSLMLGSIMKEYDSGETFFNKPLTEPKGIFKMMRNAER